eukprot:jgi/Mesen1/1142/ME001236S00023
MADEEAAPATEPQTLPSGESQEDQVPLITEIPAAEELTTPVVEVESVVEPLQEIPLVTEPVEEAVKKTEEADVAAVADVAPEPEPAAAVPAEAETQAAAADGDVQDQEAVVDGDAQVTEVTEVLEQDGVQAEPAQAEQGQQGAVDAVEQPSGENTQEQVEQQGADEQHASVTANGDKMDVIPSQEDEAVGQSLKRSREEKGGEEKKWPGWPGENVYRLIVPVKKVGGIIGRKGEFVKKMCEETRARIKILEGIPGTEERVVVVSAKEEPDLEKSPAMVAFVKVHQRVIEGPEGEMPGPPAGTVSSRMLVAANQASSLIGRQGSTVKQIQEESGANVRVLPADDLPLCAMDDDRVVEISGEARNAYKAVALIVVHLRRFLVDRSVLPSFESQNRYHTRPQPAYRAPVGPPISLSSAASSWQGGGYGGISDTSSRGLYGSAARSQSDAYTLADQYSSRAVTHGGYEGAGGQHAVAQYGRDPSAVTAPGGLTASAAPVLPMTASTQVPLAYADAIIGADGANIVYLRRTSGATVTVKESRDALGQPNMTIEMSGTAAQVQAAQQIIQKLTSTTQPSYSAAQVASGAATAVGGGSTNPQSYGDSANYSYYGNTGSQYASQATLPQSTAVYGSTAAYAAQPATTYGTSSVYGGGSNSAAVGGQAQYGTTQNVGTVYGASSAGGAAVGYGTGAATGAAGGSTDYSAYYTSQYNASQAPY